MMEVDGVRPVQEAKQKRPAIIRTSKICLASVPGHPSDLGQIVALIIRFGRNIGM